MSREQKYPAPPFDAELAPALAEINATASLDELIAARAMPQVPAIEDLLAARDLVREDRTIPGSEGDPDLTVRIFKKRMHVPGGPGFYNIHGGGIVAGDRFGGVDMALEWVQLFDGVAVSVEYRLAPEHPDPAPIHDCYAGLVWTAAHAGELGFDPGRIIGAR